VIYDKLNHLTGLARFRDSEPKKVTTTTTAHIFPPPIEIFPIPIRSYGSIASSPVLGDGRPLLKLSPFLCSNTATMCDIQETCERAKASFTIRAQFSDFSEARTGNAF